VRLPGDAGKGLKACELSALNEKILKHLGTWQWYKAILGEISA